MLQLLLGAVDVLCGLVEDNLSAGDFVRLSMCCKGFGMLVSVDKAGLLYRPMQRTFPFITGLASGRKMSYYMSILRTYFQDQGFTAEKAVRVKHYMGLHFPFTPSTPDRIVRECIRMCRTTCFSAQGRKLVLAHLNELTAIYGRMDAVTDDILRRITLVVSQAFCVQRRRLQPGKAVRHKRQEQWMRPAFDLMDYDCESEGVDDV
jgi:hypothetical protein